MGMSLGASANAQTSRPADIKVNPKREADAFSATARLLEGNFFKAYANLDLDTLEQPSLSEVASRLSAQAFQPRASAGVTWSVQALNENQAQLCVRVTVEDITAWRRLLQRALRQKWRTADAGCSQAPAVPPSSKGSAQSFIKIVDRRDIPTATVLPGDPSLDGVPGGAAGTPPAPEPAPEPAVTVLTSEPSVQGRQVFAVNRPALELTAGAPFTVLTVVNPFVQVTPGPPPVGRVLTLNTLSVRAGFEARHNCTEVAPSASCAIEVRYSGSAGNAYVGSLRGTFSNGARFRVGLLGRVAP